MAGEKLLLIAAGGTGGHMFPAQALAEAMVRRGWRVKLSTDARGARYAGGFPNVVQVVLHTKYCMINTWLTQNPSSSAVVLWMICAPSRQRRSATQGTNSIRCNAAWTLTIGSRCRQSAQASEKSEYGMPLAHSG